MKSNLKQKNITKEHINTTEKMKVTKKSEDYCIINNQKIEGNACSTILNDDKKEGQ